MIFLILILIIVVYFTIRNNFVHTFRCRLNDAGYEVCKSHLDSIPGSEYDEKAREYHEKLYNIWSSINDISYDRMLYSFKPLKEKYWLSQEQIDFLNLKFDE